MMPIPKKLLAQGVRDMVRISDCRMSVTTFATVVLHVSPEAAAGGLLSLVRDGDLIKLDVPSRTLLTCCCRTKNSKNDEPGYPDCSALTREATYGCIDNMFSGPTKGVISIFCVKRVSKTQTRIHREYGKRATLVSPTGKTGMNPKRVLQGC